MRWDFVPAAEVPEGEQARKAWLYEHWAAIDAWVEQHKPQLSARER
jgi:hypothetical protein